MEIAGLVARLRRAGGMEERRKHKSRSDGQWLLRLRLSSMPLPPKAATKPSVSMSLSQRLLGTDGPFSRFYWAL